MAEKVDIDLTGGGRNTATVDAEADAELKRKLAKRMGLAVVLIAVLLGALAIFDRISSEPSDEIEAPSGRPPVPLPRQDVAKPVQPAVPAGTPPDAPPVTIEKTSATATPTEAPPKPEVQAQPAPPSPSAPAQAPAPAVASAAPAETSRAPAPRPLPAKTEPRAPATVAEGSAVPLATPPASAAPASPPAAAAPVRPLPLPARPASGYVLQAGVFSSAQRAEELHARLQLNGIASSIESRVQVGPFGSRVEADAARAKLKALGIESVLIPPRGSR